MSRLFADCALPLRGATQPRTTVSKRTAQVYGVTLLQHYTSNTAAVATWDGMTSLSPHV